MGTLHFLADGFSIALQWHNLVFAFLGVLIGTAVGVLPVIGPISGVIPVTATLTSGLGPEAAATSAIILLAGVYYGAMYGGSTTSILLNTPGESSSVVTTLDGYQMARQGRAGAALSIAALGSFIAGIVALIALVFLAEPLSKLALQFGPAEYFSLMILGLCAVSGLAGKSMTKSLIMTVLGLLLATIGMDTVSGVARFTYNIPILYGGLEFLTLAVGLFALSEVFKNILEPNQDGELAKIERILPTKKDLKDSAAPIARGSILGFFIGILPGAGAIVASFFSYILEKKISKNPEKFGTGAIEGVAAPESANNAASGGAMIPCPMLFTEHPQIAWGVIASMFVGNMMLLILNLPLVRIFVKIIETPRKFLLPMILAISVFGVYAVQATTFDLILLIACGIAGYFLAKNDFPLAPIVLGLVLGPMIENNLRRALTASNGDYLVFLQKPISLLFLSLALLWIIVPLLLKLRGKNVLVNDES